MKNVRTFAAIAASLALIGTGALTGCSIEDAGSTGSTGPTSPTSAHHSKQDEDKPGAPPTVHMKETNSLQGKALADALKAGGYTIFVRHGHTGTDFADQALPDLKFDTSCKATDTHQRMLDKQGIDESMEMGKAIKALGLKADHVWASQYCRAIQTAEYAGFEKPTITANLNFAKAADYTKAQRAMMKDQMTPYLAAEPAAGENNFVFGHDDVFESATGIYPEPMGVAFIIKPKGDDTFEIITHIDPTGPNSWDGLVKAAEK